MPTNISYIDNKKISIVAQLHHIQIHCNQSSSAIIISTQSGTIIAGHFCGILILWLLKEKIVETSFRLIQGPHKNNPHTNSTFTKWIII